MVPSLSKMTSTRSPPYTHLQPRLPQSPRVRFRCAASGRTGRMTSNGRKESRSDEAPDSRKDSLDLGRGRCTTLRVPADQHGFRSGGPSHRDVAKGVLAIAAGLVTNPPVF